MGICRDSRHKRRATGGKRAIHQKKRKYELGRPAAMTKLGGSRKSIIRTRGANVKHRALRVEAGNFSWGSEAVAFKAKIYSAVYHPSSNEFVRTNTVTKNTIVSIDATPFKTFYRQRYGVELGKVIPGQEAAEFSPEEKAKHETLSKTRFLEPLTEEQFNSGRLLACVSSRPGQVGSADGYILEGKELEFYKRKMDKKKK
ncbi:40S ribosomal protein S8 [Gregarina niphandrodes]|uniref:40S ribosomal protein S8 n=1 Tax=Gregarina niphandrodes TaxID=110365 RepID=A0A023AX38_GRENI|nr:40S ribosomal protein S8 [Gregarina niphandrodes]EZG43279.1 40S ribosomal protein S8 [Gregarina niphandrodes]|eukprot:XP_011133463.1 40S ribosomal protein S8 [Gregarina niphandrodes]